MAERSSTGAIVLAGGRGTRMGGVDKASQMLGATPLIAHVLAALKTQCAEMVINANGDAARFAALGVPVVPDDVPDFAGPLAGILAGLDYLVAHHPDLTYAVSAATDTPFLPVDLVEKLDAARLSAKAEIAVARSNNIVHPTFALWPIDLRADLREALIDEDLRRVTTFFSRYRCAYADWSAEPFDPFFNVNTPADLRIAERILAGRKT
ncbi:MAG: molybdenum cofactor guanylyltransferase MobA [Methylovirgula sp.]|uniref:molybdenum cofactor guanylyltransferase MobA n=1 Tax=Methylovirgula sp. TaxID=1978224 RepID=UPI0030764BEE